MKRFLEAATDRYNTLLSWLDKLRCDAAGTGGPVASLAKQHQGVNEALPKDYLHEHDVSRPQDYVVHLAQQLCSLLARKTKGAAQDTVCALEKNGDSNSLVGVSLRGFVAWHWVAAGAVGLNAARLRSCSHL